MPPVRKCGKCDRVGLREGSVADATAHPAVSATGVRTGRGAGSPGFGRCPRRVRPATAPSARPWWASCTKAAPPARAPRTRLKTRLKTAPRAPSRPDPLDRPEPRGRPCRTANAFARQFRAGPSP
ncbi:tetracycline resistance efflux system leader peptide [Streptomyces pseudovenezuelae]